MVVARRVLCAVRLVSDVDCVVVFVCWLLSVCGVCLSVAFRVLCGVCYCCVLLFRCLLFVDCCVLFGVNCGLLFLAWLIADSGALCVVRRLSCVV